MRFQINVGGQHSAQVVVDSSADNAFTGVIDSEDYGKGEIRDGVRDGDNLKGTVSLDGYDADFAATISGAAITGTLSYGWFFKESFTGAQIGAPS